MQSSNPQQGRNMTPTERFRNSFPQTVVDHCIDKLMFVADLTYQHEAEQMYFRHHGFVLNGKSTALFKQYNPERDQAVKTVHLLHTDKGIFFPVTAYSSMRDTDIVVTYLTKDQVVIMLMYLFVLDIGKAHNIYERDTDNVRILANET